MKNTILFLVIFLFVINILVVSAQLGDPGPYPYSTYTDSFSNSHGTYSITVYYPTTGSNHPAIMLSPGLGGTKANYIPWGNHLASHGYVTMLYSVPSQFSMDISQRTDGFVTAAEYLISENSGTGTLSGKVDITRMGATGHSYGGGATVIVSTNDPQYSNIKVGVGLAPYTEAVSTSQCSQVSKPIKLMMGSCDTLSKPSTAQSCYDNMPTQIKEFYTSECTSCSGLNCHNSFAFPTTLMKEELTSWFETYLKGGGAQTCPDGTCDSSETCLADNCCNGITITGDCCSTSDCSGTDTCVNYFCTSAPPLIECSDGMDNDGDGQTDLLDSGCDNVNDNDESNCGDGACEGGELCDSCISDCGECINEIIIDNLDAGTSQSGSWQTQTYYPGYYSTNYHYAPNTAGEWFEWTTSLTSGTYEVSAWWVENSGRPDDSYYTVTHSSGTSDIIVNQQIDGGQWNVLGNYTFSNTGTVSLISGTPSTRGAIADAIRFREVAAGTNCGGADNNPTNGIVSISELISYIGNWKSGSVLISELITAIGEWKNGC